jgi:murein DD-endopeptidase MepM/ murein hydrolase activator NlpD
MVNLHPFRSPTPASSPFAPLIAAIRRFRRQLGISSALVSVFLGLATLLTVLSTPAQAVQVQVQPTNPQLGDTITVLIQTDGTPGDNPSVTLNQTTYPAFPLSPNRYRALVPTTPFDRAGGVNLQVNVGNNAETIALQLRDRSFPTQSLWISGVGSLGTDYEFDRVDEFKQIVTPERHWNGAFLRPSPGEITTVYGVRRYYNGEFAEDYFHRGVDYAAPTGDPIIAPAAGRVALVGRVENGFELHGNTIGIDHGQGVVSIFLHLSRIDVQEGDFVQAGQRIGAVGTTGGVTGAHLHWGLYVHGQSVDPVPWRYGAIE